jgi:hypothetical protein
LDTGKRTYDLANYRRNATALLNHLLTRHDDWISILMTLFLLEQTPRSDVDTKTIEVLTEEGNPHIRMMAQRVLARWNDATAMEEKNMDVALTLPDIILRLKPIEIFEGLSVSELAAVASVTEEVSFESGRMVIKEGDPGDTLYLILEGEVAVIKTGADGNELTLDHITAGDHFGEMALFEDIPRTASIRTTQSCRMLMLHKQAFNEMVREYPQIALKICKVFSGRIRKLHRKIAKN